LNSLAQGVLGAPWVNSLAQGVMSGLASCCVQQRVELQVQCASCRVLLWFVGVVSGGVC